VSRDDVRQRSMSRAHKYLTLLVAGEEVNKGNQRQLSSVLSYG